MKKPIICHKDGLFSMLEKKGRVHMVPEEMLVQAHRVIHPHTQLQKPNCHGAHKAAFMGFVPPYFGTRHQHKSLLGWLRYVQNGLKSVSLITKPAIKPITSWTDTCWVPSRPRPGTATCWFCAPPSLGRWMSPGLTWFSRMSYTQSWTPRFEHLPFLVLQMNPCNFWKTQPSSSSHILATTSSEAGTVLLSSYLFLKVN